MKLLLAAVASTLGAVFWSVDDPSSLWSRKVINDGVESSSKDEAGDSKLLYSSEAELTVLRNLVASLELRTIELDATVARLTEGQAPSERCVPSADAVHLEGIAVQSEQNRHRDSAQTSVQSPANLWDDAQTSVHMLQDIASDTFWALCPTPCVDVMNSAHGRLHDEFERVKDMLSKPEIIEPLVALRQRASDEFRKVVPTAFRHDGLGHPVLDNFLERHPQYAEMIRDKNPIVVVSVLVLLLSLVIWELYGCLLLALSVVCGTFATLCWVFCWPCLCLRCCFCQKGKRKQQAQASAAELAADSKMRVTENEDEFNRGHDQMTLQEAAEIAKAEIATLNQRLKQTEDDLTKERQVVADLQTDVDGLRARCVEASKQDSFQSESKIIAAAAQIGELTDHLDIAATGTQPTEEHVAPPAANGKLSTSSGDAVSVPKEQRNSPPNSPPGGSTLSPPNSPSRGKVTILAAFNSPASAPPGAEQGSPKKGE